MAATQDGKQSSAVNNVVFLTCWFILYLLAAPPDKSGGYSQATPTVFLVIFKYPANVQFIRNIKPINKYVKEQFKKPT